MIAWHDGTTYSQSDKVRTPRTWHCYFGKVDITIHRHIDYKDKEGNFTHWLLSSRNLSINRLVLENAELEEAKNEALDTAKMLLKARVNEWQTAIDMMEGN